MINSVSIACLGLFSFQFTTFRKKHMNFWAIVLKSTTYQKKAPAWENELAKFAPADCRETIA